MPSGSKTNSRVICAFDGKQRRDMTDTFEAFLVVQGDRAPGPIWYRAGYRSGKTGNVICALELPASIVEPAILREATLTVVLSPDGHVKSSLCGTACEDVCAGRPLATQPLDQLVAQSVAVENLHLEEITFADLNSLLRRLQRSITLVQEAMKHLPDSTERN